MHSRRVMVRGPLEHACMEYKQEIREVEVEEGVPWCCVLNCAPLAGRKWHVPLLSSCNDNLPKKF